MRSYNESREPMPAATTSFIQGASRGLGLELVRQLLAVNDGASVFASCRNPENAAELQSLKSQSSGRLRILKLDVSDEKTILEAAKQLEEQDERVSLIINVAGVLHGPGFSPRRSLPGESPSASGGLRVNAFGPYWSPSTFTNLSPRSALGICESFCQDRQHLRQPPRRLVRLSWVESRAKHVHEDAFN